MRGLDEFLENQANERSDFKAFYKDKPKKSGTKIKKEKMARKVSRYKEHVLARG